MHFYSALRCLPTVIRPLSKPRFTSTACLCRSTLSRQFGDISRISTRTIASTAASVTLPALQSTANDLAKSLAKLIPSSPIINESSSPRFLVLSEDHLQLTSVLSVLLSPDEANYKTWSSQMDQWLTRHQTKDTTFTIKYGREMAKVNDHVITTPHLATLPGSELKIGPSLTEKSASELTRWLDLMSWASHLILVTDPIRRLSSHPMATFLQRVRDMPITIIVNASEIISGNPEAVRQDIYEALKGHGWTASERASVHLASSDRAKFGLWMGKSDEVHASGIAHVVSGLQASCSGQTPAIHATQSLLASTKSTAQNHHESTSHTLNQLRHLTETYQSILSSSTSTSSRLKNSVLREWFFPSIDRAYSEFKNKLESEIKRIGFFGPFYKLDEFVTNAREYAKDTRVIDVDAARAEGRFLEGSIALYSNTTRDLEKLDLELSHHMKIPSMPFVDISQRTAQPLAESHTPLTAMLAETQVSSKLDQEITNSFQVDASKALTRQGMMQAALWGATIIAGLTPGIPAVFAGVAGAGISLVAAVGFGGRWIRIRRRFFERVEKTIIDTMKTEIQLRFASVVRDTVSLPLDNLTTFYNGRLTDAVRYHESRQAELQRVIGQSDVSLKHVIGMQQGDRRQPKKANVDDSEDDREEVA